MSIVHPVLRSARLRLEPLAIEHAAAMLHYYERNRTYLEPWEPVRPAAFYTFDERRSDIEATIEDTASGRCARFVAFDSDAADIAASINLWNIRRGVIHAAIVGYSVDERRSGRGYASEMLGAIVRYAFDVLNLHRIETSYQPSNHASGRVLEKNGFTIEGHARAYLYLNGAWRDGVLVSRINDAWHAPD
jgi:ribosomal-protein-alanine N-acetyltransferase